jgi:membrane peptidoglycan carboxypeptidase
VASGGGRRNRGHGQRQGHRDEVRAAGEKQLAKNQILERCLNIVPFGNQVYGVFAASQVYFKKKPKDLTVGQAAMLAGIVKTPTSFNPASPDGY